MVAVSRVTGWRVGVGAQDLTGERPKPAMKFPHKGQAA